MSVTVQRIEDFLYFHLHSSAGLSYIMRVDPLGFLQHTHIGQAIAEDAGFFEEVHMMFPVTSGKGKHSPFGPIVEDNAHEYALSMLQLECPVLGTGDYREPAIVATQPDGTAMMNLKYKAHEVLSTKPAIPGMPSLRSNGDGDCATLRIDLLDELSALTVSLYYCVFRDLSIVSRWMRVSNGSTRTIQLERALSASMDLEDNNWTWMNVAGHWAHEMQIQEGALNSCGIRKFQSLRGVSSHQHNPFCILRRDKTTEREGEALSMHLVYSGNFLCQSEVDSFMRVRVQLGIHPENFKWQLESGSDFHTPECVIGYTNNGLGDLSRTHHNLYRAHLFRTYDRPRPVVLNAWEALTFSVNEKICMELAEAATEMGVELFVVDDGWFKGRNDDLRALGDWTPDPVKFPNGLSPLINRVHELGMSFGLWVEPEMVCADSDLYRAHPGWVLQVHGRTLSTSRHQLVLDLTRTDVQDFIIGFMRELLGNLAIDYIKWDMNRPLTDIGSLRLPPGQQQEVAHRYVLGLYHIFDTLTTEFPNVLFENCSSGGGRMDPGTLSYFHQSWTSDNTDAVSRVKIQYGSSLLYPINVLTGHVSDVPNQQTNRNTPIEFRGAVSLSTIFGYELNPLHATEADRAEMRKQISFYKSIRHIVERGDFYRLKSPFNGDDAAWMFVTPDKSEAYLTYFMLRQGRHLPLQHRLKLQGLEPSVKYHVRDGYNAHNQGAVSGVFSGAFLMNAGYRLPMFDGDFQAYSCVLKRNAVELPYLGRDASVPLTPNRDIIENLGA